MCVCTVPRVERRHVAAVLQRSFSVDDMSLSSSPPLSTVLLVAYLLIVVVVLLNLLIAVSA
jgi:hypothetical protein